MALAQLLQQFYTENNIPENGGINDNTFKMKVFFINVTLPNPKFRKEVTHIHDLQHILNNCDTSWKGEAYIAGWEISTGFWKHFPIAIFSLWAMGYSFWVHPKALFQGFKKGINNIGIIDLGISKDDFMAMELSELVKLTTKPNSTKMNSLHYISFYFWCVISQVILLLPLILIGLIVLFCF